jgi:hypothetical protein
MRGHVSARLVEPHGSGHFGHVEQSRNFDGAVLVFVTSTKREKRE